VGGLYVLKRVTAVTVGSIPGGLWSIAGLAILGLWLAATSTSRYIDAQAADVRHLVTWRARPSRKAKVRRTVGTIITVLCVSTLIEYMQQGSPLLEPAVPALIEAAKLGFAHAVGFLIGTALVGTAWDQTSTFTAFETGLQIDDYTFVEPTEIRGYELTDTELIIDAEQWHRSKRLRRSDIDDVGAVCDVLDRYEFEGTGHQPTIPESDYRPGQD
jgi:hypothetical protein